MNDQPATSESIVIRPPRLIQSLTSGFNAVASHIYLILLPVALDLLMWFGPHLRVKNLFEPVIVDMLSFMRSTSAVEMAPAIDSIEALWKAFLTQYNLISTLSTFPVGVPSMMSGLLPMETPLGAAALVEAESAGQAVLLWLGFWLLGLALGVIYFSSVARTTASGEEDCAGAAPVDGPAQKTPPFRLPALAWQTLQVGVMVISLLLIVLILMVPTLLLSSVIALFSPILAQLALLLLSFGAVWFLVPMIFWPHGIFLCGQSVINAMINSVRVVRVLLPGTGTFLLVVVVLNQGLGVVWRMAPETSWMALVGVLGNAFITTGLIAASFFFYRGGLAYVRSMRATALKRL